MLSPATGEQAFSVDSDKGELTLYLGASTTSGPIREMGLDIVSPTVVNHDMEWYAEPFHGIYEHKYTLYPFEGTWQQAHLPKIMRENSQQVYVRQVYPASEGSQPAALSFIEGVPVNAEITKVFCDSDGFRVRLNEKEGRESEDMSPYAIKLMDVK